MTDSDSTPARPSKVTLGASLGAAACFVLIFTLFDTLGRLRGVEMRSDVEEQLAEPPFDTLDVSVDQLLSVMRAVAFVDGALAAAGLVLAVFCFRRHQGARYGFTVVAALLLLTAPVAGLLSFLAAAAAVMLWSEESRAWFAGREPRTRDRSANRPVPPSAPERHEEPPHPQPPVSAPLPPADGAEQPPPYSGSFAETSPQPGATTTLAAPAPGPPPAWTPTPAPAERPGTVTAAAVLSLVGALLGLGMGLILALALGLDPDGIREALRDDENVASLGWELDRVIAVLWACAALLIGWSVAALVLGVLVLRRQGWARWALLGSAAATAVLSLMAILSVVAVVPLLMGAATVGLLMSRSASAWFAGSSSGSGYTPPPTPPPSRQDPPGPW